MRINNPQLFNGQYLVSRQQVFEKLGLTVINDQANSFGVSGLIDAKYLNLDSIYTTAISALGDSLSGKFASIQTDIDNVKQYNVSGDVGITVNEADVTVEGGVPTTQFTVGIDSTEFKLEKLTDVSGNFASQYAFKFNDQQLGDTIDIPKDQFLTSAAYIPSAEALQLIFQLPQGESNIVTVPVGDLVDEYSAGNGINIIDNVEGKNLVSIKLADGNEEKFLSVGDTGLKLSGVQTAIDTAATAASGAALTEAKAYTDAASGALQTSINNLISGQIQTNIDNIVAVSGKSDDNAIAIDQISGFVSGLPDDIVAAQNAAIASGKTYTDQVSAAYDLQIKTYIDDKDAGVLSSAKDYADDLDFAQIVKVEPSELPDDGSTPSITKDTLWVTAEGDAKIGIVGENGVQVIDISKEVATEIGEGAADVVASTQAVAEYVNNKITDVNNSINALNTIVDVPFTLGPSQLSATIEGGKVLAVYTKDGEQCYPTVTYNGGNSTISVETLSAEETFVATVMRYAAQA